MDMFLFKKGWAFRPCPLKKSPLYIFWLLCHQAFDKNFVLDNYTKVASLYYNWAG